MLSPRWLWIQKNTKIYIENCHDSYWLKLQFSQGLSVSRWIQPLVPSDSKHSQWNSHSKHTQHRQKAGNQVTVCLLTDDLLHLAVLNEEVLEHFLLTIKELAVLGARHTTPDIHTWQLSTRTRRQVSVQCLHWTSRHMYMHTHTQTDGQVEDIMPLAAQTMGRRGINTRMTTQVLTNWQADQVIKQSATVSLQHINWTPVLNKRIPIKVPTEHKLNEHQLY